MTDRERFLRRPIIVRRNRYDHRRLLLGKVLFIARYVVDCGIARCLERGIKQDHGVRRTFYKLVLPSRKSGMSLFGLIDQGLSRCRKEHPGPKAVSYRYELVGTAGCRLRYCSHRAYDFRHHRTLRYSIGVRLLDPEGNILEQAWEPRTGVPADKNPDHVLLVCAAFSKIVDERREVLQIVVIGTGIVLPAMDVQNGKFGQALRVRARRRPEGFAGTITVPIQFVQGVRELASIGEFSRIGKTNDFDAVVGR